MTDERNAAGGDPVDPEVRRFADAIAAAYAANPLPPGGDTAARRAIAEKVRAPWREGGPVMAETREFSMDGIRLRLHRPVADRTLPAMLYIHGGGWVLFSVDTHDRLMREYAARAGIAVIGIDYSLAPEHKFPKALEECSAALDWIAAQAAVLDLDAGRLLVGGDSAGANLSVATCLYRRDRGLPLPAGMLLNYGAFAPDHLPSYDRFDGPAFSLEAGEMDAFWNDYVSDPAELANPLVAPLHADLAGLPPAFLAIAACDILADCNHALAARLADAGVPTRAQSYEGATHSFLEAMSIAALANRALDEQAAWIGELLAR